MLERNFSTLILLLNVYKVHKHSVALGDRVRNRMAMLSCGWALTLTVKSLSSWPGEGQGRRGMAVVCPWRDPVLGSLTWLLSIGSLEKPPPGD